MSLITIARQLWLQIRNEKEKNANSAIRVGDAAAAILDAVDVKVETVINPSIYVLGQSVRGGKVGYILQSTDPGFDVNVQKGLIVNNSYSEVLKLWPEAVADGLLPTETQLLQLCANKDIIGGFYPELYWTSTEVDETHAFCVNFGAGYPVSEFKTNQYRTVEVWTFENSLATPDYDEIAVYSDESGKFIKGSGKKLSDIKGSDGIDGIGITSIVRTSGNGTAGTIDTYTITYSDNSTSTYTVRNGANGVSGISPNIGGNGNWWIGGIDTGISAQGLTSDQKKILNTIPLVCSDETTDITASTTVRKNRYVFQTAQNFTNFIGELIVPAVGGTFTVIVKKNGVSIFSTNMTFNSGSSTTRTATVPCVLTTNPISFSIGDYVEVFVTGVGSITPGQGLTIYLM